MIYLNSCLRCKGDVRYYDDTWGIYMKCLQCGQTWNSLKAQERADIEAELAANTSEPDLVAADSEEGFEEVVGDPLGDPIQIRRASYLISCSSCWMAGGLWMGPGQGGAGGADRSRWRRDSELLDATILPCLTPARAASFRGWNVTAPVLLPGL